MTFRYLPAPFRRISEPFTAHCKFFRQIYQKKRRFSQNFQFFFFIPMIIPMLLLGHNTKKKYWPKSPQLKKPPKMPKNANFGAYFDHFLSFWWPSLRGELRGYSFVFWYVSLQNMKKHRFFSIGKHGTPCHHYKSNPLKRSANVRGGSEHPNPA